MPGPTNGSTVDRNGIFGLFGQSKSFQASFFLAPHAGAPSHAAPVILGLTGCEILFRHPDSGLSLNSAQRVPENVDFRVSSGHW